MRSDKITFRAVLLILQLAIIKITGYPKFLFFAQIYLKNVNVKVTLVQALRLCTDRTAHRGSKAIALLFHDQRH